MSQISASIIKAYSDTNYCVYGEFPLILRIGTANELLKYLYLRLDENCGAFLTAFNPFSVVIDEAANSSKQIELANELAQLGLTYYDGLGVDPSGKWPAEPSFFVLGLSLEITKAIGKKYQQNAVIWCGADALPNLVLLK